MLRRNLLFVVFAAAVAAAPAAAAPTCTATCYVAPAGSGALFLFSGHGWGHGVGMSQYGAYGYAQHGYTFQQILAHYYPDTTLGPAPVSTIRVLLADKKKTLQLSSTAPFTVRDDTGKTQTVPAGTLTLAPTLKIGDRQLVPPLQFTPGRGAALTLARPYRGRILVDVVDGKLRAVNVVGLEQYLYGVVPSEMPSTWSPAALEAQAVAARSYALATRQVGAPFDAYSDTRSQVYLGISHESPTATAAVNATKHQVVLYNGAVATTYFSSTSGGKTESSRDWNGTAVPYLVSVSDPYDDISPYHNWGPVPMTAQAIAKALKMPGPIMDATTTPDKSGRVAQLNLRTPLAPVAVPATKLRAAIGLRSTWFSVAVLSLAAPTPNPPVTYGSSVSLEAAVRGVSGVTLEQRPNGGEWQPVAPVSGSAARLTESPTATTDYRLSTASAAAGSVKIRVAPAITVSTFSSAEVSGSAKPLIMGAPVAVQQQNADGTTWSTVATGTVSADGAFTLPVQLEPGGTYRVTVGPAAGYVMGTTTPRVVAS